MLLGSGQTLVDTASQTLIPALVPATGAAGAGQRPAGRHRLVAEQLVGPPAGGLLFAVSAWFPFAVDAVSFAASSALIAAVPGRRAPHGRASEAAGHRAGLRAEIAEGWAGCWRIGCCGRWRCGTPGSTSPPLGALVGGMLARSFGLPAPFLVAGVAIPVVTLLILPFVNRRTVQQALAAVEQDTASPATGSIE